MILNRFIYSALLVFLTFAVVAQQVGDYRSRTTGPWTGNIWQVYNGTSWLNTAVTPVNNNVEIRHNVTVSTGGGATTLTGNLTVSAGEFTIINTNGNNTHTFTLFGNFTMTDGHFYFNRGNNSSGRFELTGGARFLGGSISGSTSDNSINEAGFRFIGSSTQLLELGIPNSNFTAEYRNRFFVAGGSTHNLIEKYSASEPQTMLGMATANIPAGYEPWPINSGRIESLIIDNPTEVNLSTNRVISSSLVLENGLLNLGEHTLTITGNNVSGTNGKISFNDTESTLAFNNSSPIILPPDIFHNTIRNLSIINNGGVKVQEDIFIEGILNLDADNPNPTDGLLDLVRDYDQYATARYSTDEDGRLLTNYNNAPDVLDNTSPFNRLDSYTLTMGPNATTVGRGDVIGRIRRTTFSSGTDYTFGNENMRLRFTSVAGSNLPEEVVVTVTKGPDHGVHPDKARQTLSNDLDSLLGVEQVNRLYQVNRIGGERQTRFRVRFPYEQNELSINNESSLVTWDHHIPYVDPINEEQGLTPHEHGYTTRDAGENWVELDNHGLFYLAQEGDTEFTKYWMLGEQITRDTLWIGAAVGVDGNNWNIASNWTSGKVPTATTRVVIPESSVYTKELIIENDSWDARAIEIRETANVRMEGNSSLTIHGGPTESLGFGSWQNNGTYHPSEDSKVLFLYDNATISGKTTFSTVEVATGASLEIQSNSENTILKEIINNGELDASSNVNKMIFAGNNQLILNPNGGSEGYYDLIITGAGVDLGENIRVTNNFEIEVDGLLRTSNFDIELEGDFINNGDFNSQTGSLFAFRGTSDQFVSGKTPVIFNNVMLNKPGGSLRLGNHIFVNGELEMLDGDIYSYEDSLLTIGTDVSNVGTISHSEGFVYGPIKRWYSNTTSMGEEAGLFPIGFNGLNRFVTVEYRTAPSSGGTLKASWVTQEMGNIGLPFDVKSTEDCPAFNVVNTSQEGYWQIDDEDGLTGGEYDITMQGEGLGGINDLCQLTAVKRVNGSDWFQSGTHVQATGDIMFPVVKMEAAEGWSNWGIAGGAANPLPVELLSFTASCEGREVLVQWSTASELNSEMFILEKSFDGIEWAVVHEQPGAGNSSSTLHYEFVDNYPGSGLMYYQLRQRDFDGTEELFGPVSSNCKGELNEMNVFPNPSKNFFTVEVSSNLTAHSGQVQVYNSFGQLVETRNVEINKGINQYMFTNNLKSGTYIVRVVSPSMMFKPFNLVVVK